MTSARSASLPRCVSCVAPRRTGRHHQRGAAIELFGQSGDSAAAIAIHDDAVEWVSTMWQRLAFQAQVRLAALLLGQLATAAATATGVAARRSRPSRRSARRDGAGGGRRGSPYRSGGHRLDSNE